MNALLNVNFLYEREWPDDQAEPDRCPVFRFSVEDDRLGLNLPAENAPEALRIRENAKKIEKRTLLEVVKLI